jgi:hypothetical protein
MDERGNNNAVLAECLVELGWAPTTLARKVNRLFGAGTVSVSAPYHWVDRGGVPRAPLPTLTAYVLSQHLGRPVSVRDLWQGRADDSPLLVPADTGMDAPWSIAAALQILEDWLLAGLMDRRTFLAASGTTLTGLAWEYLGLEGGRLLAAIEGDGVGATLIAQLEGTIPTLWALDDAHGGQRVLPYVSAQFQIAAHILRQGGHDAQATQGLFRVVALLGQHAGWAAFDAGRHGLAQRYYLTALRAAHQAGDRQLGAHVLADLAFQAASTDAREEAGDLAEVAMSAAAPLPPRVQASVASRAAFAHGASGDEHRFAACRDLAHEQLDGTTPEAGDPDWMYYLTPGHIDALAASSLVRLAQTARTQGRTRRARTRLRAGLELLQNTAALRDRRHPHQRRAAVEGAWLTLAYTLHGDLDQACRVGRLTISRLDGVQSDRCTSVLATLRGELRSGRMNNPDVRAFVPELERALHAQHARNQPRPLAPGAVDG